MAKSTNKSFPVFPLICGILIVVIAGLGYKVYAMSKDEEQMKAEAAAKVVTLPDDAVKITECIPHEGEHWVQPDKVPNGPYYVTYKGKVMSVEYMLAPDQIPGEKLARSPQAEFTNYIVKNNKTLSDIVNESRIPLSLPATTYKTVHIGWTAPHAGFLIPHYDIHFDFVTDEELRNVCPDARLQDVYSPEVLKGINQNNIPFPGQ